MLSSVHMDRYNRHLILDGIGERGQQRIINSKVLIIGAGGLGSPCIMYLAGAGVGTIGIVDGDVVDSSNIHRQIIHFDNDVDKPKVQSAKEKVNQINPEVNVITYQQLATPSNIKELINEYDFVIDATDNFAAKFLINDACVLSGKPFSHGGVLAFEGQALTYTPGNVCYRCIFTTPPKDSDVDTCKDVGVLSSIPGILGTIQATEALKYISGNNDLLLNKMLIFDGKTMNFRTVKFKSNTNCPVCGEHPAIIAL